ncbi:very-long-chain 3-ketoacyl-synthase [Micractinium conductrix]|uniref:very-long-chain 3-oxoacyl-CoA synthase n=1 Tax=Micractinium conductrix TaxID=554055 RepID=A0A2P6VLL4_9CHLO|nr:very-long-chain 3-ketoacyl-synthase [Micractinium conductrix]|eukprot:PSC74991.1 very-long-chain 3-ketoacyl-synthase [Micractinium conductrix]
MAVLSRAGARPRAADFPPQWMGPLLKAFINWLRFTALAMSVSGVVIGLGWLVEQNAAGLLAPAVDRAVAAARQPVVLPAAALAGGVLLALAAMLTVRRGKTPVYLLDFECYRPEDCNKVTYSRFVTGSKDSGFFDEESMDFQVRILNKSGLSEETFFPPGLHKDPPEFDMKWAREEAELVMFNAVKDLLAKTRLAPRDIDVLVVNCSLFNPTPSLSAMIINHFGMRSNIDSFNLGGMGCSAGIIAVDLAAKMLRERGHGGYALVVSTENITQNWYHGNERSMLIPNTIFRMGSAAILLTSHAGERPRSKYELQHVVRCHLGANDEAYKCVFQRPDDRQFIGVELDKNLVSVASKAMETNMTRLGPLVLPWSEKLVFAANWVARNVLRMRVARYIPDFREAFDHFCLHAGGRGVVEGLSKQLRLTQKQMAPSANTLHWYGNTSSSTVWYSFGFVESVQGVKRGDIVWQIGFGSGFKCNSVVWRALRPVKTMHKAWQHISGREGQALEVLARIAAETAAERQQKENGQAANGAAANGVPQNGHDGKVNVSLQACKPSKQEEEEEEAARARGRVLRSGKVVA